MVNVIIDTLTIQIMTAMNDGGGGNSALRYNEDISLTDWHNNISVSQSKRLKQKKRLNKLVIARLG